MWRYLRYLAAAAMVVLLVAWVGTGNFLQAIRQMRIEYLGLSIPTYVTGLAVVGIRWRFLLSPLGPYSFRRSMRAVLAGQAMAEFTPGRAGDAFRAYMAKKDGVGEFAATLPVWAVERLLDVVVIASAALLTSATLVELLPTRGLVLLLAVPLLTAGSLLALILVLSRFPKAGERLFQILLRPLRRLRLFEANPAATFFASGREALQPRRLVPVLALTALFWSLSILRWTLVARGLGADVPLSTMAFIVPAAYLASAIPITPGGLGLLELGATSLLVGVVGIPPAQAAAIPFVDRAVHAPFYIVPGLLIATVEMGRRPLQKIE